MQLLQNHLAGPVSGLAAGDLTVFDDKQRMRCGLGRDFMHNNLATAAKFGGNALGNIAKHFQFMRFQHKGASFSVCFYPYYNTAF